MKYKVILADPPVPFEVWGKRPGGTDSRSAEAHYSTMTWEELNGIGDAVRAVAADDCCLFLWMCQPVFSSVWAIGRGRILRMYCSSPEAIQSVFARMCIRCSPRWKHPPLLPQ